jgi:nucleoside-diphosphate-sugar epimerase
LSWLGTDHRRNGSSRSTVLVTGATGFLGRALVHRLLSPGTRVRVLVRSPAKGLELAEEGAEVVLGSITDVAAVRAAVHDVDVIYHLAGRLFVPGVPATIYRTTHVDGTRILLACCAEVSGLKRFVHCSTTGVLGVTGKRPANEGAPIRPTNVYEETKAEAEFAVRQQARDGLPAVIARPGLVYGPGDLHLLPFFKSVLGRRFRPIGREPVWLHPIYIDDLTAALSKCGRRDAAIGECFHFAGQEPVTLERLAEEIALAGGTRRPSGHIPTAAAQAVAALGDRLPPTLKQAAPLTSSRLEFLTHSRVYDVSKAERLLDFAASTDLHSGVATTMAWYRARGHLGGPKVVNGWSRHASA